MGRGRLRPRSGGHGGRTAAPGPPGLRPYQHLIDRGGNGSVDEEACRVRRRCSEAAAAAAAVLLGGCEAAQDGSGTAGVTPTREQPTLPTSSTA
jgi:hypothetical protein